MEKKVSVTTAAAKDKKDEAGQISPFVKKEDYVKEAAPKKTSAKDTQIKETPVKETPVKEAPVKVAPVKEAPMKEIETAVEKKEMPKKTAIKKTTKKKNTKAETPEISQEVYVQYAGQEVLLNGLLDRAKQAYIAEGHRASAIKSVRVYVKPEEGMAYYVINEKASGGIALY